MKQVAFYGGSFTALPRETQADYLREVEPLLASGLIDSIRVSTRPDALGGECLSFLKERGVKTVELGAQSMIDRVLRLSGRGHGREETISATSRLKQGGFEVGLHLMMGLPGDDLDSFRQTVDQVIDLQPDFVRIHPTLVLRGAPLETLWEEKNYIPLTLKETIEGLKETVLKMERAGLPIVRIGLQSTKDLEDHLRAGPYHPALRQLVDAAIAYDMASSLLQGASTSPSALFYCHPTDVSNLRGQRNANIIRLREQFELAEIFIKTNPTLPRGSIVLEGHEELISIHRREVRTHGR